MDLLLIHPLFLVLLQPFPRSLQQFSQLSAVPLLPGTEFAVVRVIDHRIVGLALELLVHFLLPLPL